MTHNSIRLVGKFVDWVVFAVLLLLMAGHIMYRILIASDIPVAITQSDFEFFIKLSVVIFFLFAGYFIFNFKKNDGLKLYVMVNALLISLVYWIKSLYMTMNHVDVELLMYSDLLGLLVTVLIGLVFFLKLGWNLRKQKVQPQ